MSGIIHPCERCGKQAVDWHHKFHRHKNRVENFGIYLMDHPFNGAQLCHNCHTNHKAEFHFNEREFCEAHNLFGYCKKRISCFIQNFPFYESDEDAEECRTCREYEFDKEYFYKAKDGIKENLLIPGSYKYKP